ncbi:MAG: alpha/beta hydrolase [Vallitaleaceae bacterium]|nr:alpha/beta hydrolase [Vallitaleaceae bacterium]
MKKISRIMVVLSIVLILVGSSLGAAVQSDFGKISVKEVQFVGEYGNIIHGHLFIPDGVSKENKAPGIINIHGYLNTKEFQTGFSVEYARRGYVVLAIDMPGHGYSDPVPGGLVGFFSGGPEAFKFMSSLEFVDKDSIALEGHSMGGWNSAYATQIYGDKINTVVLVGSSSGTFGLDLFGPESPFNFAVIMGDADEFVGLNWEVLDARKVNSSSKLKTSFGTEEDVEVGKLYGSFEEGTARKLYIASASHAGEHISKEAIGSAVGFVQDAMPGLNPLPPSNQIWPIHELAKLLNLIGLGLFIVFFGSLLLETTYFRTLIQENIMQVSTKKDKKTWLFFAVIATAIPAITYFKFKAVTFLDISFMEGEWWRPQGLTYSIASWALLNSVLFLLLFILWHSRFGKRDGGNLEVYGILPSSSNSKFNWPHFGKALLLASAVFGGVQGITGLVGHMFKIDFRFWVVGFKALQLSHFKMMLIYFIPFFIFFFISSIAAQSYLRLNNDGETFKDKCLPYVATIIINGLGIGTLVLVNLWGAWTTGEATFANYTLEAIVGIQFIVMLPFSGIITTYFNKKTGTVYVSSLINSIFITAYIIVGQAVHYFPLR